MANPKKVRFDGLDCTAITTEIRTNLLGSKLANIYDGQSHSTSSSNSNNTSTYLFKLVQPAENKKCFLLIESGIRFHLTEAQTRSNGAGVGTGAMPSPFAMKLRKNLNNKRLESITQLGNLDRVVDLRFGSGTDSSFHLLLEFYAKGNIILTSHNYEILALLRSHEYGGAKTNTSDKDGNKEANSTEKDNGEVKVAVGQIYPVTFATTLGISSSITDESSDPKKSADKEILPNSILEMDANQARLWIQGQAVAYTIYKTQQNNGSNSTSKKKKKKNGNLTLKMALLKPTSGVYHYGPSLLDHCILSSEVNPNLILECIPDPDMENGSNHSNFILDPEILPHAQISLLLSKLKDDGSEIIKSLTSISRKDVDHKGYILYESFLPTNTKKSTNDESDEKQVTESKIFLEFIPHLLFQHKNQTTSLKNSGKSKILYFDSFSQAVDHFFSHLDIQKRTLKAANLQSSAQQKLANIQADQNARMETLVNEQAGFYDDAQWIEMHAENIDNCLSVVNSALDSGMDWDSLESLVQVEQQNGNELALLIHALVLEKDALILNLPGEKEDESRKVLIQLDGSAHQNARMKYQQYRQWKEKAAKTQDAHKKALEAAEITVQKQLMEAAKTTRGMTLVSDAGMGKLGMSAYVAMPERKPFWFEKFRWFITSDNYLVLAGRDAHQNEILVKRYLRPGDAYLHADVFGASSCILRAKRKRINRAPKNGKKAYSTQVLPLPEQALREAGHFTICHSSSWSTKMITSAWYVESHQVSKTAPSGEYLTVGSFMVRGKKTFLQPVQLEMGLGVLFTLGDAASIARHRGERRDFSIMEDTNEGESATDLQRKNMKKDFVEKEEPTHDKEVSNDNEKIQIKDQEDGAEINVKREDNISSLDQFNPSNEEPSKIVSIEGKKRVDSDTFTEEQNLLNESEEDKSLDGEDRTTKSNENKNHAFDIEGNEADNEEILDLNETAQPEKKTGISVKERRLIKKYGSLENAKKAMEDAATSENPKMKNNNSKETVVSKLSQPSKQQSRGKKSKAKRSAKKYSDQDEEDRQLALLALHGSGGGKQRKKDKNNKKKSSSNVAGPVKSSMQIKAAKETLALLIKDSSEVAQRLPERVRIILASCVTVPSHNGKDEESLESQANNEAVRWDKYDADVLEKLEALENIDAQMAAVNRLCNLAKTTRIDNYAASLAGILRTIDRFGYEHLISKDQNNDEENTNNEAGGSKARKNKAEKQAEKEAWNRILAEDGILLSDDDQYGDENGDEAIDDTAELSKLTGKPLLEDAILCAVPVCAPYQTLSQYKYRVKLTPGSLKRGKAVKQCADILCRPSEKTEVEKRNLAVIKHISHNEWVQAICGDVKIAAAGASKLVKNNKKSNRSKGGGKKKS